MTLSRRDAQRIAEAKLNDALLLAQHQRYSTAYYLCGYAVEIGLKAAVARTIQAETIPAKGTIDRVFTHDFARLVTLSGLGGALSDARKSERFEANWSAVSKWSPDSRYAIIDQFTAIGLIQAVSNAEDGVFKWLQKHW